MDEFYSSGTRVGKTYLQPLILFGLLLTVPLTDPLYDLWHIPLFKKQKTIIQQANEAVKNYAELRQQCVRGDNSKLCARAYTNKIMIQFTIRF